MGIKEPKTLKTKQFCAGHVIRCNGPRLIAFILDPSLTDRFTDYLAQEGEEPRSTATPPAEQDQPPPAAVLLDSPTEGSVSAAAVPSTPTGRSTRSRSRRKAAKPKCSAGGDDEVCLRLFGGSMGRGF